METLRRLRRFFPSDDAIGGLTPERAAAMYEQFRTTPLESTGSPPSVDYHRNLLGESKTFLRWCVDRKLAQANALEKVKGTGRRRRGKAQLRLDEARLWLAKAIALADKGEQGAVAAMTTILMGLRANEVVCRMVRDLDDNGRLLWIDEGGRGYDEDGLKTAASKRTLAVPEEFRPYLVALTRDKSREAPLFDKVPNRWAVRKWVQRICDEAGVTRVSAHSMRGLYATLSVLSWGSVGDTAERMGHASESTTIAHYLDPNALAHSRQKTVLGFLRGDQKKEGKPS